MKRCSVEFYEPQSNSLLKFHEYCSKATLAHPRSTPHDTRQFGFSFHITTTTSGTSLLDLLRPLLSGDAALAVVALVALTLPWIFLGRFLERTDDFEEALAEAEASSDRSTVVALP